MEVDQEFENQKFAKFDLAGKLENNPDDNLNMLDAKQGMEIEDLANKGKWLRLDDKNDDVKLYKKYLKTKAGAAFVTNVLRVALNYKEERLAG